MLSLTTVHSFELGEVARYLHSASVRSVLIQALLDAPMFITRWRWVAGVSLALPRFRGGKKVPPQRDNSNTLVSLSGADPLNLAGILTPGPKLAGLTRNRVLYRDGIPIALLEGGEIRFLETLEAGSEWEARKTLLRSSVPPPLTHLS